MAASQIESDDRSDEQQPQQIDDRHAPLGETREQTAQEGERLTRPLRRLTLEIRRRGSSAQSEYTAKLFAQGLDQRLELRGRARDVFRRLGDQALRLPDQGRQHGHHHADDEKDGECRRRGGGQAARQPPGLQPGHHRIEKIGHDRADDERQKDVVEQPKCGHEQHDDAEPEAPADNASRLRHLESFRSHSFTLRHHVAT
jgi:hypothetical protein